MHEKKKNLRAEMRLRLKSLTPEQRLEASRRIQNYLLVSDLWKQSPQVALYVSRPDEPETGDLMEAIWREGRQVLLPRVAGENLEFYQVPGKGCLEPGSFGLLEPVPSLCQERSPSAIDLILIPGLAFDKTGRRLGRGRGYYDRFLAQAGFKGHRLGLFFALQEVAEIPGEEHDQKLDGIQTETGTAL